jgi:hypothetical protein
MLIFLGCRFAWFTIDLIHEEAAIFYAKAYIVSIVGELWLQMKGDIFKLKSTKIDI